MARTGQQLRIRTTRALRQSGGEHGRQAGSKSGGSTVSRPPVRSTSVSDRLRYLFDNSMSRGTPALIGWLSAVTLALTFVFAVITTVFRLRTESTTGDGFGHEVFYTFLHALDPGYIGGDVGSWRYLLTMLVLTIFGLFIISALIGVIAAGIDEKLAELRRGRSLVIESDHTVILGWSDSVFTIVGELSVANESRKHPVVVILADRDKVEMEDELRAKVPELRGTRVICRSGSPIDLDDLAISSHATASSVILLAPDSEDPDAEVIKTLLALTHDGAGVGTNGGPGIVAEIRNPSNLEAARLAGGARTVLLDIRETVAKLVVQTSRQSGAAAVYTDLFDYDGDEFYFHADHGLDGTTYAGAQQAYEHASVVGLVKDGSSKLNPPMDTVIDGHTLIVVVDDDSSLVGASHSLTEPALTQLGEQVGDDAVATQALLIGWNERAPIIVRELDHYAVPGSTLTILTAYGEPRVPPTSNLAVSIVEASTTDRATLEAHLGADLDQVIVLCYSEHLSTQTADARTLITLLHVRDVLGKLGVDTPVVSEMLDDRNRVLASVTDVDDVVVSGEIVSLLVTQLSQDQRLEGVFSELLDNDGSEIYLRPAPWYVQAGAEVSWATMVAGATARGETAIGFKSASLAEGNAPFGVLVNPAKSDVFTVDADDRVVVLAEH